MLHGVWLFLLYFLPSSYSDLVLFLKMTGNSFISAAQQHRWKPHMPSWRSRPGEVSFRALQCHGTRRSSPKGLLRAGTGNHLLAVGWFPHFMTALSLTLANILECPALSSWTCCLSGTMRMTEERPQLRRIARKEEVQREVPTPDWGGLSNLGPSLSPGTC